MFVHRAAESSFVELLSDFRRAAESSFAELLSDFRRAAVGSVLSSSCCRIYNVHLALFVHNYGRTNSLINHRLQN